MSPTARTLAYCRAQGWICGVVEKWNPHARIRQDLFGFIDIVAVGNYAITGIQATSTPNMSARVKKIEAEPRSVEWRRAGGRILVIGWSKRGPRGKPKRWTAKEVWL